MQGSRKLSFWMAAMAMVGFGAATLHADVTRDLRCLASGNWNDQGHRTSGNYQIGYSTQLPHHQAAYFIFDYSSIKGKKVTNLTITIQGSTDFNITDVWVNHTPAHQFKVGIADQGPNSVNEIMNGNNNQQLYINASDEQRNGEMGYGWVKDGLHPGFRFDAWHFQLPTSRDFDGYTFQPEVNAGGIHALWACDRFDNQAGNENYIWGNTKFNNGIVLHVTTTN
ncbi:MAG: hypothetical protein M3O30_05250 [Planctomycetota bacterium]|nr:hypothetical protein [Planctomycetota bacterium]